LRRDAVIIADVVVTVGGRRSDDNDAEAGGAGAGAGATRWKWKARVGSSSGRAPPAIKARRIIGVDGDATDGERIETDRVDATVDILVGASDTMGAMVNYYNIFYVRSEVRSPASHL
jgi:hypothetical protein